MARVKETIEAGVEWVEERPGETVGGITAVEVNESVWAETKGQGSRLAESALQGDWTITSRWTGRSRAW